MIDDSNKLSPIKGVDGIFGSAANTPNRIAKLSLNPKVVAQLTNGNSGGGPQMYYANVSILSSLHGHYHRCLITKERAGDDNADDDHDCPL